MDHFVKLFFSLAFLLFFQFGISQNSNNPWAISVGLDLINVQDDNVDSGLNFGAPALSLSRYLGAGFSLGAQYALNNVKNTPEDFGYASIDGIVKYNLSDGKILPLSLIHI